MMHLPTNEYHLGHRYLGAEPSNGFHVGIVADVEALYSLPHKYISPLSLGMK